MSMDGDSGRSTEEKKRKWMYSLARKKAEKESRLYSKTVCFVCHYYCTKNQEERKVVDVVSSNILDIHTDYYNKVFYPPMRKTSSKVKLNEDDVSAVIKEFRTKIENELTYFFENMINVDTKQAIKDFLVDFKQGNVIKHTHIWDSRSFLVRDDDDRLPNNNNHNHNPIGNGRRKKKTRNKKPKKAAPPKPLTQLELQQQQDDEKVEQEEHHYEQALLLLETFAQNKDATPQERITLQTAYCKVLRVSNDFSFSFFTEDDDDSWCHRNVDLFINKHRSKVAHQLNYVCNNVSNLTIKQAFLPLLADYFQTPKDQIHHPHLQDKYDISSGEDSSDMSSGEESSKPLPPVCDDQLYDPYHDKCCCTPVWAQPKPVDEVVYWQTQKPDYPDLTFADVESEEDWWSLFLRKTT